ncbi:hypothetical protein [Candidatus Williamhamiltonella defendens]|uniref:Uncharacterized protein n=1 Tax=Candidatus Hamiltonella defensa (Bemisia tabaci) TaxID=672795 RepID=A0A249E127_9ENTR|nr:hypothetical protein [Candidatus Hamiltonella defensa]ASX26712.1 hypothetical protein BA171_06705 [Candidatus Hamiltonella defensa (Bemisia tabaci)]
MSTTNLIDYFNGFIGRLKFACEILHAGKKAHRNVEAENLKAVIEKLNNRRKKLNAVMVTGEPKAAILLKENTTSFNHDENAVSAHNSISHFHDSNHNFIINQNKSL